MRDTDRSANESVESATAGSTASTDQGQSPSGRPPGQNSEQDSKEETGVRPAPNPREPTLSEALWGTSLYQALPMLVDARRDIVVVRGDWERAGAFLQRFPQLREESSTCMPSPQASLAKQRYIRTCCDLLELRQAEKTVGVFVGAPDDWSTYYCRLLAFDPSVSARVSIRRFFNECLVSQLRNAGVERFVAETAPTNAIMIRWFSELGFQPTGQRLTERWGPFIQFTKFLREESGRAFLRRFAPNGVVAGANDNSRPDDA